VRTKYFSRGIASILLALALLTPIVFVATPASAASFVSTNYSNQTIQVTQGKTFALITRLGWDEIGVPGYYGVTIVWEDNNNKYDNFTVVGARAWIDNDNDNVYDGTDIMLENSTTLVSGAGTNGTRWTFTVSNTTGNDNEGWLCVEIVMQAASRGIIHRPTDNHPINKAGWGGSIDYAESTPLSTTPIVTTVDVEPWTSGVLIQSGPNAFDNTQPANPPKQVYYPAGPIPLAAAQRIGSGAVMAAGLTSTLDNGRWNIGTNPYGATLDEFLDSVMQWMVPGADNVLWFNGYGVFQWDNRTRHLAENLTLKGYYIDNSNLVDNDITVAKLAPYDIFVIPGLQLGGRWSGGDPSLLPDNNVAAINSWVSAGGGLIIFNNADFSGYNFYRVHNKILNGLGFGWRFQCDSVYDNVDFHSGFAYYIKAQVLQSCPGCGYKQATGQDNIGIYSATSLITPRTFSVDVSLAPASQSGIPPAVLNYTVTVNNTGTGWDNYTLSIADTAGWTPTLSATKLYVAAGASNSTVTASVTIPALTPYCTNDTITVTATGTENSGGTQATDSANAIAHATAAFAVEVDTISPETQTGDIGTTVTASVTVWNNGAVTDNLNLSASDTRGWGLTLDNTVFLDVPSGESRTTTLNIAIPGAEFPSQTDEITVLVTSGGNPLENDENKCWVTTELLREVEVWVENQTGGKIQEAILIINENWCGKRYDPLSFKVKVYNLGILNDAYELTAWDNTGTLMLEVMPPELYIPAGKFDIAELSVTVPENAIGCTWYTIWVRARGKLASGTLWDPENAISMVDYPENENCCWVKVHVQIARCVRVDILTENQTGTPGSKLKWWIRIKNLGNVDSDYALTVSQDVFDETGPYPIWPYVIEPPVVSVPACSIGQAWVEFIIPMDLKTSVRNIIDIRATNLVDPLCTDVDYVEAHVLVPGARIPNAWMKVTVEAEVKAIELWPDQWSIGILDETDYVVSPVYTVRNTGNVNVDVLICGQDAKSAPGEPVTTWTLSDDGSIGVNVYGMAFGPPLGPMSALPNKAAPAPTEALLVANLLPTQQYDFKLALQAPGVITVPAKMWTIVTLRAI